MGAGNDSSTHVNGINSIGIGFYSPGESGGEELHQLSITEMPKHNHKISSVSNDGQAGTNDESISTKYPKYGAYFTDDTGGDLPHENRPPYYALAYIMKL